MKFTELTSTYVEIKKGIYWVGMKEHDGMLHCNPYLVVDGDEGVLIDPGSKLDFEQVLYNVKQIIPLKNLKYIVLHHSDPDLCSSTTQFEELGLDFKIVCHRWTQTMVRYYGVSSKYHIVNDEMFKLKLSSGRELIFVETPYLHYPGSITTYDPVNKILFSSDLFGAFSSHWELYANDDYIEKMKDFHEYFMPSRDILEPVMEIIEGLDLEIIASQHGSIINSNIDKYIKALKDLECGAHLTNISRKKVNDEGYKNILNQIVKRLSSVYTFSEVLGILEMINARVDPGTGSVISHPYKSDEVLDVFFDRVYLDKGIGWLAMVEALVKKLTLEYELPMPGAFKQSVRKSEIEVAEVIQKIEKLKEENQRLSSVVKDAEERMMKCPLTHLYNINYFKNYMKAELNNISTSSHPGDFSLVLISIDNLAKIKYLYGDEEVDEVLVNTAYLLQDLMQEKHISFRIQGATFAVTLLNHDFSETVKIAEQIRNRVNEFEGFIEKITVSIGLVTLKEFIATGQSLENIDMKMYEGAMARLGTAKTIGMNVVCSESEIGAFDARLGRVLIVDSDFVNVQFLKNYLEDSNFKVFLCDNGIDAYDMAQKERPDVIISDVMLQKMGGFSLRERLMNDSITKNIPFMIISHQKNEDSVKRAISLDINHYFKKPYMVSEVVGIIKNKLKGVALR